jgi:hypothetical protein
MVSFRYIIVNTLYEGDDDNNDVGDYYYHHHLLYAGLHTYMHETNHVSRVHSVAAILRVLLMVHITLFSLLNSFVLLH